MARAPQRILLGDIGATNARFALLDDGVLSPLERIVVAEHASFRDAVETFLTWRGNPAISSAIFAVAGPVDDDRATLTNSLWVVDGAATADAFKLSSVRVINDFAATAWALPRLTPAELRSVGGGRPVPGAPMAVLGPGTGLGVAAYVPACGGTVIATEGGHSTLHATSAREEAVIAKLRERFGHVSCERTMSGHGLENLHRAIAQIDGIDAPDRHAAEITEAALAGTCAVCEAALDMFCAMLGSVAGNLALTYGARGGVYVAGGIAPRIVDYLLHSRFRAQFDAKGRLRPYLEAIPLHIVIHPDATFIGLKALAERNHAGPA